MRRPFVAGNWKMNTDRASAVKLAMDVACGLTTEHQGVDVCVCPPAVYLDCVGTALSSARSRVSLGAQNASSQPNGAFTGEVSLAMLENLGVRYVLVGHSERRHALGESDEAVHRKTVAVLSAGLECILCVGETIEQRRAGETDAVNERQLMSALVGVRPEQLARLTIAYEPVWAIGTGHTATPRDAQSAHEKIRGLISSLHGPAAGAAIRILYGGSVKAENAQELFASADVDGGLVGGASLKAADFLAIVGAAAR